MTFIPPNDGKDGLRIISSMIKKEMFRPLREDLTEAIISCHYVISGKINWYQVPSKSFEMVSFLFLNDKEYMSKIDPENITDEVFIHIKSVIDENVNKSSFKTFV